MGRLTHLLDDVHLLSEPLNLPLHALTSNLALSDTTVVLLPQAQLGSQTYSRVARLSRSSYGATPVDACTIQRLFYAE